ncbi:MAG: DUF4365 domain-containing protein [Flavobacteriaceae bacterium]
MNDKKPIILDTEKIGALAVTYIQTIFEEKGWIFRRADGSTDYGIDSEVEITDINKVTGKIFKCQIKGTQSSDFVNDFTTVQVSTSTWNNWKTLNIPVIALLCTIDDKEIYWTLPLAYEPKKNADSISLRFYKKHCLNSSFSEFKSIIDTWLDAFPKQNILREIPFFHNMFSKELEPLIDWGDPWCDAGEDYNMKTRVFYSHVLELRLSLGLRSDKILPFDFWLIRNQGIWDEPCELYHGTLSELISYIKYYYEEALVKLKRRLEKVEPSFENNELVNYFNLHPLMQERSNVSVVYSHPFGNNKKFHELIESELLKIGYTPKFKWNNESSK